MSFWSALATFPTLFIGTVFVLGLLVGSFLNVVIHRLPKMLEAAFRSECALIDAPMDAEPPSRPTYSLVRPRSCCPACGAAIAGYDNIPLLSWLYLRGRCRHCHNPISVRYPIVELTCGLISAGLAAHFGFGWLALGAIILAWVLIALFWIDIDTYMLPDDLTLPLLWMGLLFNLVGGFVPLPAAVIGAAAGYLCLWSVYWLFKLITGREGMGYGDFKLLAALGAWMGWQALPNIILLSSLVGAVIGISLTLLARREWQKPLPYGPYLALAGLISLVWGDSLRQLIWAG